jgi:hypothetical protein
VVIDEHKFANEMPTLPVNPLALTIQTLRFFAVELAYQDAFFGDELHAAGELFVF